MTAATVARPTCLDELAGAERPYLSAVAAVWTATRRGPGGYAFTQAVDAEGATAVAVARLLADHAPAEEVVQARVLLAELTGARTRIAQQIGMGGMAAGLTSAMRRLLAAATAVRSVADGHTGLGEADLAEVLREEDTAGLQPGDRLTCPAHRCWATGCVHLTSRVPEAGGGTR